MIAESQPIFVYDVEQGSDDWKELKLGVVSASCFDRIITSTGKSSSRAKVYQNKLLAEWLTGVPIESFKNEWMDIGNIREGQSRSLYEMVKDTQVKEVGFVYKNHLKLVGSSPDGLSQFDVITDTFKKGYETKCPSGGVHIENLLSGKIPSKHIPQVQGSMYVTGLDSWDFMSYYPGMKPLIVTVERDTRYINLMHQEIELFVEEMLEKREILLEKREIFMAA